MLSLASTLSKASEILSIDSSFDEPTSWRNFLRFLSVINFLNRPSDSDSSPISDNSSLTFSLS